MYCRHLVWGAFKTRSRLKWENSWHLLLGGMTGAVDTGDS